ncbi:MAG TPA: hypothetical protein VG293_01470, partial [Solirubrobacteraceae bacterium]|nr:hypothetical protein [Solirubrobacteraceae bacterium]
MMEFERTPGCICNVLAVLSDGEESMRATLCAAIELAESSNSRLTLVKTCEQGRAYVWVAPFAVGAAYLPPELESPDEACQVLSRLVSGVPDSIPVTMSVLTSDSQTSLLKILHECHFGAIVIDRDQLALWSRVRRRLRHEQLQIVLISPAMNRDSLPGLSSSGLKDGAANAVEVPEGRGRR